MKPGGSKSVFLKACILKILKISHAKWKAETGPFSDRIEQFLGSGRPVGGFGVLGRSRWRLARAGVGEK